MRVQNQSAGILSEGKMGRTAVLLYEKVGVYSPAWLIWYTFSKGSIQGTEQGSIQPTGLLVCIRD
jgi:hypothetical protein